MFENQGCKKTQDGMSSIKEHVLDIDLECPTFCHAFLDIFGSDGCGYEQNKTLKNFEDVFQKMPEYRHILSTEYQLVNTTFKRYLFGYSSAEGGHAIVIEKIHNTNDDEVYFYIINSGDGVVNHLPEPISVGTELFYNMCMRINIIDSIFNAK